MMIILSKPVSVWLSFLGYGERVDTQAAYFEGSPIDRVFFSCIIAGGLFVLLRRKVSWSHVFKENRWLIAYLVYCGVSITWSEFPYISLKRWIKELGGLIMVLIIATETRPFEAIQSIVRKCSYVLIPLSVVFIKYFPEIGRGYNPRTGEVFYHGASIGKNGLGTVCLICGFFLVVEIAGSVRNEVAKLSKKDKGIVILISMMTLWVMIMSRSATGIATLLIGSVVLLGLSFDGIRKVCKSPAAVIVGGSIIVIALLPLDAWRLGLELLGRDETMTGRTDIWQKVLSIKTNPIIGAGYESFWLGEVLNLWEDLYSAPNQSHNGFLEIYLNLGYIGLALLGGILISSARKAIGSLGGSLYSGIVQLAFLVIFVLYNITEYGFRIMHPAWLVFLFFSIGPVSTWGKFEVPAGSEKQR
jgi:O-antigen ligase